MKTKEKRLYYFLILAVAGYVIKNFFVGADTDEGYGILLGYRLAVGDKLLLEMWEPHQTSAIFTVLFIKPFMWITGGNLDFLNLYLRMIYFMVHGLIAFFMYFSIRKCVAGVERRTAVGMALVYFVSSPKSIYIPEYSNLNVWFFALLCICFMWYFGDKSPLRGRIGILTGAGLALTCEVLSYPSMVILFPVCLLLLGCKRIQSAWKQCLALTAPCVMCAIVLVGYISSYMTIEQILQVLPHIVSDGSHQIDAFHKFKTVLASLADIGFVFLLGAVLALAITWIWKKRKKDTEGKPFVACFFFSWFVVEILFQFYFWFTSLYNPSYPQHTYLFLMLVGIFCYCKSDKKEKIGFYIILLSLIQYLGVILFTNWKPMMVISYLVVGAVGGLLCWNSYFGCSFPYLKNKLLSLICGLLVLSNVFGYCYLIIGGPESNAPIFEVSGYSHNGFRKGILTGYMTSYRYNQNSEIWAEAIPEGSNLLYVGPNQCFIMLGNNKIASHNTISTPTYDENMLAYWEMNPDRYPDVVAIESCYGDVGHAAEGDFFWQWLENEFCATEIIEYPYIKVYRK